MHIGEVASTFITGWSYAAHDSMDASDIGDESIVPEIDDELLDIDAVYHRSLCDMTMVVDATGAETYANILREFASVGCPARLSVRDRPPAETRGQASILFLYAILKAACPFTPSRWTMDQTIRPSCQ